MEIKYTTGKFEVIDTKILNVLDNEFRILIDGVPFWFGFMDTKEFKGSKIAASKGLEEGVYKIAICNFDFDGIAGFFDPMPLGIVNEVQYYYNLCGWAIPGKEYSVIVINILRKM
jgi:hypothetical protein